MSQPLALIFPGQGSQQLGMLRELAERYSVVGTTFEEASDALGYDLWKVVQEGPEEARGAAPRIPRPAPGGRGPALMCVRTSL